MSLDNTSARERSRGDGMCEMKVVSSLKEAKAEDNTPLSSNFSAD